MSKKKSGTESKELVALVKEAELESVFLSELRAKFFEKQNIDFPLKSVVNHEVLSIKQEEGSLSSDIGMTFKGLDKRGRKLLEIRIVYNIRYKCDAAFPDETVREFMETSAVVQLWPFFRKHLLELTAEMGFPPFVLPLLKFLPS